MHFSWTDLRCPTARVHHEARGQTRVSRTSRELRLAPHGQFPDITGTLTGCSQTSWEDEEMEQNHYESPGPGGLGHHEAQGHARVSRTSRGPRLAPRGPFSDLTITTTGSSPSSFSKLVVTLLGGRTPPRALATQARRRSQVRSSEEDSEEPSSSVAWRPRGQHWRHACVYSDGAGRVSPQVTHSL